MEAKGCGRASDKGQQRKGTKQTSRWQKRLRLWNDPCRQLAPLTLPRSSMRLVIRCWARCVARYSFSPGSIPRAPDPPRAIVGEHGHRPEDFVQQRAHRKTALHDQGEAPTALQVLRTTPDESLYGTQ